MKDYEKKSIFEFITKNISTKKVVLYQNLLFRRIELTSCHARRVENTIIIVGSLRVHNISLDLYKTFRLCNHFNRSKGYTCTDHQLPHPRPYGKELFFVFQ